MSQISSALSALWRFTETELVKYCTCNDEVVWPNLPQCMSLADRLSPTTLWWSTPEQGRPWKLWFKERNMKSWHNPACCPTNKTQQKKSNPPPESCSFSTMYIFENHVMRRQSLLRKAWVVIRSFGHFLGLFKERQAEWIWKMLLTQTNCLEFFTIGLWLTDFGTEVKSTEM